MPKSNSSVREAIGKEFDYRIVGELGEGYYYAGACNQFMRHTKRGSKFCGVVGVNIFLFDKNFISRFQNSLMHTQILRSLHPFLRGMKVIQGEVKSRLQFPNQISFKNAWVRGSSTLGLPDTISHGSRDFSTNMRNFGLNHVEDSAFVARK